MTPDDLESGSDREEKVRQLKQRVPGLEAQDADAVLNVWRDMKREFRLAVASGACQLFGRFKTVRDRPSAIPSDVATAMKILRWGDSHGGSIAQLIDDSMVYSIFIDQAPSRKRGRRPKLDWNGKFRRKLFQLLDKHGAPGAGNKTFKTQAALIRVMTRYVEEELDEEISESQMRERVGRLTDEWCAMRQERPG